MVPGLPAVLALRRHPLVRQVTEVVAAHAPETVVHLVGGMVRDAWLGRETHDLDLVVNDRGEEIAQRLAEGFKARFVPLGRKEFGAFRLVAESFEMDLWDRKGMSVHEDLARRDLTVNAISLDLGTGEIVDPFDGLGDLEHRLLRAVTDASFSGDPLRVLRLPRFLAQMPGFEVDETTRELARQAAPSLTWIARERIREELARLFAGEGAPIALREMAALGLYPGLLVGHPGAGSQPANIAAEEMEALPEAAARLRDLARETGLPEASLDPSTIDLRTARWASAVIHLPGGDPLEALRQLQILGYLSQGAGEPIGALLRDPQPPASGSQAAHEQRRALHRLGRHWATAWVWWKARTASWDAGARELLAWIRDEGATILDPPRLLTGGEIQELLALPPGPEVGRALETVRQAQVEGRVRTRNEAIETLTGTFRRTTSSRRPSAAD